MSHTQSMPCPNCNTPIPFELSILLQGGMFSCPKCVSKIGIAQESRPMVQEAKAKFDEMKSQVLQKKVKGQ